MSSIIFSFYKQYYSTTGNLSGKKKYNSNCIWGVLIHGRIVGWCRFPHSLFCLVSKHLSVILVFLLRVVNKDKSFFSLAHNFLTLHFYDFFLLISHPNSLTNHLINRQDKIILPRANHHMKSHPLMPPTSNAVVKFPYPSPQSFNIKFFILLHKP